MIQNKRGCVVQALKDKEIDVLLHQCNTFPGVFGAGLAKQLAQEFPGVVKKDIEFKQNKREKTILGNYSYFETDNGGLILNLYSQIGIGSNKSNPLTRNTRYDLIHDLFLKIKRQIESKYKGQVLGVGKGIGCGLAGGDWKIVMAIIESVFQDSKVQLNIYHL